MLRINQYLATLYWHSPWITIAEQTKATQHRSKCDRFGCQFRPIPYLQLKVKYLTESSAKAAKVRLISIALECKEEVFMNQKKQFSWSEKQEFTQFSRFKIETATCKLVPCMLALQIWAYTYYRYHQSLFFFLSYIELANQRSRCNCNQGMRKNDSSTWRVAQTSHNSHTDPGPDLILSLTKSFITRVISEYAVVNNIEKDIHEWRNCAHVRALWIIAVSYRSKNIYITIWWNLNGE